MSLASTPSGAPPADESGTESLRDTGQVHDTTAVRDTIEAREAHPDGFPIAVAPTENARSRPRPSWWLRLAWLWILIGGVAAYVVILVVMVDTQNVNFFPALLLVGAVTVPLTVVVLAEGIGPRSPVPAWAVVLTAIVGGLTGVVAAGLLEYDTARQLGGLSVILVGVIEEAAKLIVPVILYFVWRPTDPRGGVVIGVASGTGFAVLETMGYGFQALLATGSLAEVDGTLLLRALLSPACHIAWTGMTVAMLWRIHSSRHKGRAVGGFVLAYLVAVALHALWDGSTSEVAHVAVAAFGLVLLAGFIIAARRGRGPIAHPDRVNALSA